MKPPPVLVHVAVKPGSKNPGLSVEGGTMTLRVRERAVQGAANAACVRALAGALDLPPSAVTLVRGERSRLKTFSIHLLDATEVQRRIERS